METVERLREEWVKGKAMHGSDGSDVLLEELLFFLVTEGVVSTTVYLSLQSKN